MRHIQNRLEVVVVSESLGDNVHPIAGVMQPDRSQDTSFNNPPPMPLTEGRRKAVPVIAATVSVRSSKVFFALASIHSCL